MATVILAPSLGLWIGDGVANSWFHGAMNRLGSLVVAAVVVFVASPALAQNGVPPADESATVAQQKAAAAMEANKASKDSTNAAVNLGAQLATGNSQQFAMTAGGKIDLRRGQNGFGAALIANYATAYTQPVPATTTTAAWKDTVRNLQGKLRYDRYFGANAALFLQVMGTHDAFQATTFRLNIDPGFKYLFVNHPKSKFWGEIGYDFEMDVNYTDSQGFEQAGAGGQVLDAAGLPYVINQTNTMHSVRAYLGFQHAFNKDVQVSSGLEFLQGLGGSDGGLPAVPAGFTAAQVDLVAINLTRTRLNFDALLTANLGKGLALGVGFTAKYNSAPLPGKQDVDTTTTVSLIYSFAKPAPPAPADAAACPTVPAPPPMIPTSTPSTDAATGHPLTPENTGFARTLSSGYAVKAPANGAESTLLTYVDDPKATLESAAWVDLDRVSKPETDATKDQLKNLVEILKAYPNVMLKIGSSDAAAAESVKKALVDGGIAPSRSTTETRDHAQVAVRVTAK